MHTERPTLDLHGMIRDQAVRELEDFLVWARTNNIDSVEVVTGKGTHSPDGVAVIRNAACAFLNTHGYHYEFDSPFRGGEGSLIVHI